MIVDLKNNDYVRAQIYKYDYGQLLKIIGLESYAHLEVHYDIGEDAAMVYDAEKSDDGSFIVEIPNKALTLDKESFEAWVYYEDENSGTTVRKIVFDIIQRKRPSDVPPIDVDINEILGYAEYVKENADKIKNAEDIVANFAVDTELSETSPRPIANSTVTTEFKKIETTVGNIDVLLGTI